MSASAARAAPARPPRLPFPLQDGEQVLVVVRRHWLYLWPRLVLMTLVALAVPILAGVLLSKAGAFEGLGARVFWGLAGLYMAYWLIRLFLTWYRYQNDIWVVTNQRLIDSLKTNPFNLTVSSADLVNIQDMTVHRSGLLRTLFDFGDIVCQTAAERPDFRLSAIPDPRGIQALVDRERDRERLRYRA